MTAGWEGIERSGYRLIRILIEMNDGPMVNDWTLAG